MLEHRLHSLKLNGIRCAADNRTNKMKHSIFLLYYMNSMNANYAPSQYNLRKLSQTHINNNDQQQSISKWINKAIKKPRRTKKKKRYVDDIKRTAFQTKHFSVPPFPFSSTHFRLTLFFPSFLLFYFHALCARVLFCFSLHCLCLALAFFLAVI